MKLQEIKQLARIEYIDKTTKPGGHDRTGIYRILSIIKVKNPINNKWFDAVLYSKDLGKESYAKCIIDVLTEFKIHKE